MMKKKIKLELTEQQFEDLQSAVSFTVRKYPKVGSEQFRAALERMEKKLWAALRKHRKVK